jgi:hypothetical protein
MTETPPAPDDLQRQVAAAQTSIGQQDLARRTAPTQRRKGLAPLVLSLLGLVAATWFARSFLQPPRVDPAEARAAGERLLADIAFSIEAHRQTHGAYPASLDSMGLGALPVAYTPTAGGFRLALELTAGDSASYESVTRAVP